MVIVMRHPGRVGGKGLNPLPHLFKKGDIMDNLNELIQKALETMIKDILKNIAKKHGNDWPSVALMRLLELHKAEVEDESLALEYFALLAWAKETIEAGVAFKQSSEAI